MWQARPDVLRKYTEERGSGKKPEKKGALKVKRGEGAEPGPADRPDPVKAAENQVKRGK
ncbi:hypothetical protein GSVR_05860 [Geobacter sp. SVR]|nr:hypothetical protein GSVR_05860 [Geobacter sp. SVR]